MIKFTFGSVLDNLIRDTGIVGNKNPVTQNATIDKTNFKKITILTGETDIKLRIHDVPRIDIVLETYENGPVLKVNDDAEKALIEATGGMRTWQLGMESPLLCLHVAVPLDIAESWEVKTGSGDVTIPKVRANSFQASLGSGDLELSNLKAQNAHIHTASGDMFVRDVVLDTLQFGTTSGDGELLKVKGRHITGVANSGRLSMKDVYSEKFSAKVSSGDISLSETQAHEAHLSCTSGNIKADDMIADKAYLQASSGDVRYSLKGDGSIEGAATSGDVVVICKNDQPNATIHLMTNSGDMRTNLPRSIQQKSSHNLSGVVGNGEEHIKIQTTSGDAEVLFR